MELNSPVLTDIFCATILPPITASPVQRACPSDPPTTTPKAFSLVASTTVANWDLSPHSARNVSDAAWSNTLIIALRFLRRLSAWPCSNMSRVSSFSSWKTWKIVFIIGECIGDMWYFVYCKVYVYYWWNENFQSRRYWYG